MRYALISDVHGNLLDVTVDRVCVEVVRVTYDLDAAVRGIVASELPGEFADYLTSGGRQARRPFPGA